ncbi:MAG TPA: DEAD/DEAH box helicase [Reyranella sp.]|nr:DEAD/DEAH box helicase [Reyranella sp.]
MTNVSFADLGLAEPLLRALAAANYTVPTPIQARTIPLLLQGRDVLGIAQTGTGKTAAFALPVLQHLAAQNRRAEPRSPRALVLAPTRELAVQIARSFDTYGRGLGLRLGMVIGGLGFGRQIDTLQKGVDILVATPGRLLDLMSQGHCKLGNVSFFVLDEADRMFDMGFIKDVRRISASVGKERQTLMFSATMPGDVAKLAADVLRNPERVEIAPQGRTVEKIEQRVYFVNAASKRALLAHLLADQALERVIVFTRTKRGANRVAEALEDRGVASEAIHGNKSQNARQKALDNFSRGRARVLVATDLASRGIDVQGVTHVINFELPADAESYVHRIGRTARAGASGIAISFCDGSERGQLKGIERLTNQRIAVVSTPANEDLPQAPPMRPKAEREANDNAEREQREGRFRRPPQRGGHRGRGNGHHGGGHHAGGHHHRGHAPAEHQWARGDYRDQPQDERPQEQSGFAARAQVKRPYTPRPQGDRPFGGQQQRGRRFGGGRGRSRSA